MAKKLLVVDDNDINLELYSELLTDAGFDVITADDGLKAYECYLNESPDMVITDIIMRNNGIELLTKIKTVKSDFPVITMSGGIGEDNGTALLEISDSVGADSNFQKPVDMTRMISWINHYFASRED